jgi:hypothetical protein
MVCMPSVRRPAWRRSSAIGSTTRRDRRAGFILVSASSHDKEFEVTSLRLGIILLTATISMLLVAQTAVAESQGKGGKGKVAAVGIDTILLVDPAPQGGEILAEIAGGGFLAGEYTEVLLDDVPIDHSVISGEMIHADIPARTSDGDHEVRVRTGDGNKQSATATIRLGGEMIVSCISWFPSGPADEHVHTEVHVEDENGAAVIGATVTWDARNETSEEPYQTNVSPTGDIDGHGHGVNCANPVSGSGVTGWFCCIGAGKWDGEVPPGKRACSPGTYNARILDVTPPPFTNMVWDPENENNELEASYELIDTKFP